MKTLTSFLLAVMMAAFVTGCGGGGGSSAPNEPVGGNPPPETGQLMLTLTDAEGDFGAYVVDVTSITLERPNGTVVETLPLSTRVDFAELVEVTEFLTIATVPAGRYQSVTLGLDFSDAEILVQDDAGNLIEATPVDGDGSPLGELTVSLELNEADAVVIRPGVPAAFSLDFDLDASNEIDLGVTPPTVTVEPFLLATPELEKDREHRVRGVTKSVDETAGTITLHVRPFRHRQGQFGELTFGTDDETVYEIDGVGYTGSEGLAVLADLGAEVPVVAGVAITDSGLLADTVLAGSSVPWTDHDVASGAVIARDGDVLTLSGVTVQYTDGLVVHRGEVSVLLGDDTVVTALGLPNDTLDKMSISVGQRIAAFGELSDDVTLDATSGRVRMRVSAFTGEVVNADNLAVDVYFMNARRPNVYDFTGTGIDPANDADPDHYEVDTGSLPLANVETGDLVRVRGHVNTFGMAPPDFLALTVIDVAVDDRGAIFGAIWPNPSAEAVVSVDQAHIELDLAEARSHLILKGVPRDHVNPLEAITLAAPDDDRGVYAVRVRPGEIHLFRSFADFADEVLEQLQTGKLLARAGAHGRYDLTAGELTSRRAGLTFVEASL